MLCGTIAKNKQSTPPISSLFFRDAKENTMSYLQDKIRSLKQLVSPFSNKIFKEETTI